MCARCVSSASANMYPALGSPYVFFNKSCTMGTPIESRDSSSRGMRMIILLGFLGSNSADVNACSISVANNNCRREDAMTASNRMVEALHPFAAVTSWWYPCTARCPPTTHRALALIGARSAPDERLSLRMICEGSKCFRSSEVSVSRHS